MKNFRDGYSLNYARQALLALSNYVSPDQTLTVINEDPDDNRILECAAAAQSDFIVSEDKHLLRLQRYRGISIVTISDFLNILHGHDQRRQ